MALIKNNELHSMNKKLIEDKLKDLNRELIKANLPSQKAIAKTKEIKRTIARLLTIKHNLNNSEEGNKKI
jgi:ribosomal protein L29